MWVGLGSKGAPQKKKNIVLGALLFPHSGDCVCGGYFGRLLSLREEWSMYALPSAVLCFTSEARVRVPRHPRCH